MDNNLDKQLEELKKELDEQGFKPADNFLEQQQAAFEMMKSLFKCCQKCHNNPANNPYASGICCCSIPDQEMFRW